MCDFIHSHNHVLNNCYDFKAVFTVKGFIKKQWRREQESQNFLFVSDKNLRYPTIPVVLQMCQADGDRPKGESTHAIIFSDPSDLYFKG